jgi:hypothetical protein
MSDDGYDNPRLNRHPGPPQLAASCDAAATAHVAGCGGTAPYLQAAAGRPRRCKLARRGSFGPLAIPKRATYFWSTGRSYLRFSSLDKSERKSASARFPANWAAESD